MIGFNEHPVALRSLFLTELWERFSFYSLQALLILYLVLPQAQGGLGYDVAPAAAIYGNYTMSVYLLSPLGGHIADRWLGARWTVLIGAVVIALGHFSLAVAPEQLLFVALGCVAAGTALLKPNVTALVGALYSENDKRRDAGFSLYYMGINIGAFSAPLLSGYLAQGVGFKSWLATAGFDPRNSWHWGFGAAGVGMLVGLAVFLRAWRTLSDPQPRRPSTAAVDVSLNAPDVGAARVIAIGFFCVCAVLFYAMQKQAGSSLNLFADQHTRNELFGYQFPSSWFQSVNALCVIVLAPLCSALWLRLGDRQPSSPIKAVVGLGFGGLSFLVMAGASSAAEFSAVAPFWLLSAYLLQSMGELCVSPVGLSSVTRLATGRAVGLALGLWFVAIAFGAKLAGMAAAWIGSSARDAQAQIFAQQALIAAIACGMLLLIVPAVRRLLVKVEGAR